MKRSRARRTPATTRRTPKQVTCRSQKRETGPVATKVLPYACSSSATWSMNIRSDDQPRLERTGLLKGRIGSGPGDASAHTSRGHAQRRIAYERWKGRHTTRDLLACGGFCDERDLPTPGWILRLAHARMTDTALQHRLQQPVLTAPCEKWLNACRDERLSVLHAREKQNLARRSHIPCGVSRFHITVRSHASPRE